MTKADAVISNRFKHKTPPLYSEEWGSTSSHTAPPLFKVEATIFKSYVFSNV